MFADYMMLMEGKQKWRPALERNLLRISITKANNEGEGEQLFNEENDLKFKYNLYYRKMIS